MTNEAEVLRKLNDAERQLKTYRSRFGPDASGDVKSLAKELEKKEEELRIMKLKQTADEGVSILAVCRV